MELRTTLVDDLVRRALHEDLSESGDLTVRLCLPKADTAGLQTALILAKAPGVICGLDVARRVFELQDSEAVVECRSKDGDRVLPGDEVLRVRSHPAALLAAERTALNFMQRMSGIATLTRHFVDAVAGTPARILETRKTTPTLREFEKYAVRTGGGQNHRFGLFDQVLIKENHFALALPLSFLEVVELAVVGSENPVIVEAQTIEEAQLAVRGGAAVVMLDNFAAGPDLMDAVAVVRREAATCGRDVKVEASGGIDLESVRRFAECGVDRISVGALTHSVTALDLSMLVQEDL